MTSILKHLLSLLHLILYKNTVGTKIIADPEEYFQELMSDLIMGHFRGAVFRHGGGALKQHMKQPSETLTSTLPLMGRFPSLMGRFSTLMGRFTDFVLRGRFTS